MPPTIRLYATRIMTFIFIDVEMQNDRPTIYNCRVADACVGQDAVVEIANAKLTSLAMAWSIIEHRLSASDRQTNSRAYERMTPNFSHHRLSTVTTSPGQIRTARKLMAVEVLPRTTCN